MLGLLFGFRPAKLADRRLNFQPGSVANYAGDAVFTMSSTATVDLDVIGPNGADNALNPGHSIYPYVIQNGAGDVAVIMSRAIIYAGVVAPDGWQLVRKLPFGLVLDGDGNIRDFHVSYWPMPRVDFTGVVAGETGAFVRVEQALDWRSVSLVPWVPDNSRHVYVHCEVGSSGSAGTAYLRAISSGLLNVGNANPVSGVRSLGVFPIELRSDRKIDFKTSGGATLTAKVVAYDMTEPTT